MEQQRTNEECLLHLKREKDFRFFLDLLCTTLLQTLTFSLGMFCLIFGAVSPIGIIFGVLLLSGSCWRAILQLSTKKEIFITKNHLYINGDRFANKDIQFSLVSLPRTDTRYIRIFNNDNHIANVLWDTLFLKPLVPIPFNDFLWIFEEIQKGRFTNATLEQIIEANKPNKYERYADLIFLLPIVLALIPAVLLLFLAAKNS